MELPLHEALVSFFFWFMRSKSGVNRDRGSYYNSGRFPSFHGVNEQPVLIEEIHGLFNLVK